MTKEEIKKKIVELGIIPVIRATSSKQAVQAVEAVYSGGISVIEITMTVPGALGVIQQLCANFGKDVLVGAGTVLDADTAEQCLEAGAEFLVSPGMDCASIDVAHQWEKPMIAGALTPTEVIHAWRAGSDLVKIFPCGAVGGAKYIKALKAPLPDIPMVPTGGVNLQTAAELIQAGAEALGVGGELVLASAMQSGKFEIIAENARKYVAAVRAARQHLPA